MTQGFWYFKLHLQLDATEHPQGSFTSHLHLSLSSLLTHLFVHTHSHILIVIQMQSEHVDIIEKLKYRFQEKHLYNLKYDDDGYKTRTSDEQHKVEAKVLLQYLKANQRYDQDRKVVLKRSQHIEFLKDGLFSPGKVRDALDASRSWVVYWILNSLHLLGADDFTDKQVERINATVAQFQVKDGGFGGGPIQQAHLAGTYAAVNALVVMKRSQSLDVINLSTLKQYLLRMKRPDGSYGLHDSGEVDVRGVYCALSVASLCGFLPDEDLTKNTVDWVLSCQTYEGGFGARPGCEAHGGYTFCAIAALTILASLDKCDMKSLLRWSVNRQLSVEGGFSGRTNKLVDGCYSFWCGSLLPIIQAHLESKCDNEQFLTEGKWLFNQAALQEYILCCCQYPTGGLIDKPGLHPDYYHTCYCLTGLSIAQNSPIPFVVPDTVDAPLPPVNPIYSMDVEAVAFAKRYLASK